jgi:hypothetical protein
MPELNTTPRGLTLYEHAALNWKPTCQTCRGAADGDTCENCGDAICEECAVTCSGCGETDPWCVRCALSRQAFEQRDGLWYCENCPDFAPAYLMEGPERLSVSATPERTTELPRQPAEHPTHRPAAVEAIAGRVRRAS